MSLFRLGSLVVAFTLALTVPAQAAPGTLSWQLVRAYDLIIRAMNAAVARYNNQSGLSKSIIAHYELHEIGHTIGVGTSGIWGSLGRGGTFKGTRTTALVGPHDGQSGVIKCDGQHFDSEFSQTNADRHVKIVEAMVGDGL